MSISETHSGSNRTNPFQYQKFGLNAIIFIVYRNGLLIAATPVSTTDKNFSCTTHEALYFVLNARHRFSLAYHDNHYIMPSDFTSTQDVSLDFIRQELTICIILVELKADARKYQ